jgi:5-methyltetrahydrofolate--homocysteine methyltransferase
MAEVKEIAQVLIEGEADRVRELTEACVNQGMEPGRILNDGLIAGMAEVGERFKREEIYLPEVLFAARAMKAGMEVLQPVLAG